MKAIKSKKIKDVDEIQNILLNSKKRSKYLDAAKVGGKDVPYNSRNVEKALNDKYPNKVSSNTLPPSNAKNVKLAGTRHPKTGIVFDNQGFPIFDDVAKFDTILPSNVSSVANRTAHFKNATQQLRKAIDEGQISKSLFNQKQLDAINKGLPKIPDFTWHHHQFRGRMQLVPTKIHKGTGHIGGFDLWYK